MTLEGFAEISSKKLYAEIQTHREIELPRFINALGIRHVGEETAHDLAQAFGTFDKLREASKDDLLAVEGIGETVADSIVGFFKDKREAERIDNLMRQVKVSQSSVGKSSAGRLKGTTWVLTGTLKSLSREEAKEKIRALGGDVSESVSRKTSFVVVGAEPGSKFQQAQKLGVTILNETEFLEKLKG